MYLIMQILTNGGRGSQQDPVPRVSDMISEHQGPPRQWAICHKRRLLVKNRGEEKLGSNRPTSRQSWVHGGLFPGVHLFPSKAISSQRDAVPTAAVWLLKRTATWKQERQDVADIYTTDLHSLQAPTKISTLECHILLRDKCTRRHCIYSVTGLYIHWISEEDVALNSYALCMIAFQFHTGETGTIISNRTCTERSPREEEQ